MASLWSVSDESTGELMKQFYGFLKEGQSKAEDHWALARHPAVYEHIERWVKEDG